MSAAAPRSKTITVGGREVNFYTQKKAGVGTRCASCSGDNKEFQWVSTRTAKLIRQCHCGAAYNFTSSTASGAKPMATTANKFKGFTEADFTMILDLAKLAAKGSGPAKPSEAKPTEECFISAIGDDKKLKDLKKTYEAYGLWEMWNSSLKKPQQASLASAAKAFFNKG